MEKDKLPEWLKGQAKQFELTPQQGSFDVMMRKREQQRKQRNRFVWLSMAATIAIVMSVSIWFTPQKAEQVVGLDAKSKTQVLSQNNSSNITDKKSQTSQTIVLEKSGISIDTIHKHIINNTSNNTRIPVMTPIHEYASSFTTPIKSNEFIGVRDSVFFSQTQPTVNVAASRITPLYKDSVATAMVTDSQQTMVLADTILPITRDLSKQTTPLISSRNQSHWSIMGVFTPQLMNSIYNANSDASLSWMKKYIANREQNDQALYSFNAGLKVEKTFGKHWSVSTGLLYSLVKFEEIKLVNAIVKDSQTIESFAQADKNKRVVEVNQDRFDISFSSLEVPLQVGYTVHHKKMCYQFTAGVSYAYLFQTKSLVFDPKDSLNVHETDDAGNNRLNQHSILLLGGINVGYQFSKRWSCYAGPVYRYSLNSIYSNDYIIRQQPYYLGLELGVKYSFR